MEREISCSIVDQIGVHAAGWKPHDAVLIFEDLLHPGPDIVAAPKSSDGGLLFGPALDFADDGADALVVLNRVVEFRLRVAQALGGFGFFDPPKQFRVADGIPAGVGFHVLKRELNLAAELAFGTTVQDASADGGGEVLNEFGDHFNRHPKTAGRTNTGGAVF